MSIGVGGFNAVSSTDKLRAHFLPEKPGAHGAMKYISGLLMDGTITVNAKNAENYSQVIIMLFF